MYHRYYDSYRPIASSKNRSPTIAAESEAVRYHSNKQWHRAKSFNNSTPQGDASSAVKYSRGQSQDHSSPAAPVPNQNSRSTGHDLEQLTQLYTEGHKNISMPERAQLRRSSPTVDHDRRNESEAQSRGFYGSSSSPTSNVTHLGRYELKRHRDDEATNRSPKRRREVDEKKDENEGEGEDEGEHVGASDNYRPPEGYRCKNYMCMEDHTYADCDKPKICWGCRSTNHYWSRCPMTCTGCGKERHIAKYCEAFEITLSGKSLPRTYPLHHNAEKELVEQARGEHAAPKTAVKAVMPSRDGSERRRASRNVFDPRSILRQASQLQKPARIEQGVSKTTPERFLRPLRDTPAPETGPKGRTSTIETSEHLTTSRQAPGSLSTPPSTRPNVSPRDPRRRRDSSLTPLVSPLRTLQVSPEFRDSSSTKPRMLGEPPSNPPQRRRLGDGAIPSQTSGRQEEHQSSSSGQREAYAPPSSSQNNEDVSQDYGRKDELHPSALSQNEDHPLRAPSQVHSYSSQPPARNEDHLAPASAPNEHSADDSRALIESSMNAFFEEDRVKQKQHEEEQARKRLQQRRELEQQLDEKINRLKHEADMARKAAVQSQEEEHERLLAELRQR